MSDDTHSYDPAQGHRLAHDPFKSIVGPRPIGWISSRGADGRVNLAPFSFFNAFNDRPPIVAFCSTGFKDTTRNVEATGEFVWNLATLPLAEAMNASCAPVPPDVDEFDLAGLTRLPSTHVAAPRVGESPVSFECKLTQMFRLKTKEGREVESWMMFGEVVAVHIRQTLLRDGHYQTALAQPILRGGGPGDYFRVEDERKFVMMRPAAAFKTRR